jgi:hypothetical protein
VPSLVWSWWWGCIRAGLAMVRALKSCANTCSVGCLCQRGHHACPPRATRLAMSCAPRYHVRLATAGPWPAVGSWAALAAVSAASCHRGALLPLTLCPTAAAANPVLSCCLPHFARAWAWPATGHCSTMAPRRVHALAPADRCSHTPR